MHPPVPSRTTILHAYRALLRSGLIAVQYSTPARYAIRDKLRASFRSRPASSFDKSRIDNTIEFLLAAGNRVGIEHKIVRNLCLVHYWQNNRKFYRFFFWSLMLLFVVVVVVVLMCSCLVFFCSFIEFIWFPLDSLAWHFETRVIQPHITRTMKLSAS